MSSTLTDLFGYLVLFMLAALLLWLRAALLSREEGWQRRRVNENADVPSAIMRRGVGFIAASGRPGLGAYQRRRRRPADRGLAATWIPSGVTFAASWTWSSAV